MHLFKRLIIVIFIGTLFACGGGGGSDTSETQSPDENGETDWNQMVWDQTNWS